MIGCREIRRVKAIDYRVTPYDWAFARDRAAAIDAFWGDAVAKNPTLFNGRVFVSHRVTVVDEAMKAEAVEVGYKSFLAWRDFGFPGAPLANLFPMGALRSVDGAYMLGRMAAHTASAGKLYFPAGTPEPADACDGVVDLEANIFRELQEETGLTAGDVSMAPGWTIVFDEARIACMRPLQSPLSAAALVERFEAFRAGEVDPELDALVPVFSCHDLDEALMPRFMVMFLRDAFAAS